jgi:hypothetical protein
MQPSLFYAIGDVIVQPISQAMLQIILDDKVYDTLDDRLRSILDRGLGVMLYVLLYLGGKPLNPRSLYLFTPFTIQTNCHFPKTYQWALKLTHI